MEWWKYVTKPLTNEFNEQLQSFGKLPDAIELNQQVIGSVATSNFE